METTIPPLYGSPTLVGATMRPKLVFLLIILLSVLYVLFPPLRSKGNSQSRPPISLPEVGLSQGSRPTGSRYPEVIINY
jgi:hypothetical protein